MRNLGIDRPGKPELNAFTRRISTDENNPTVVRMRNGETIPVWIEGKDAPYIQGYDGYQWHLDGSHHADRDYDIVSSA
jgi:hypothetical protein